MNISLAHGVQILFTKLREVADQDSDSIATLTEEVASEAAEIDELRRFAISIDEPTPQSYTIT